MSGNGGSQPFLTATVTLDDAQIKALPSAYPEIVSAPGADRMIVPLLEVLIADMPLTAYGNIANRAAISFRNRNAGGGLGLFYVGWEQVLGNVSQLLGFAGSKSVAIGLPNPAVASGLTVSNYADGDDEDRYNDAALVLQGTNFDSGNTDHGDFTGGDAANTLTVIVNYALVPLT